MRDSVKRAIGIWLTSLVLSGSLPTAARAQETWPTKRVTIMVGFASGGFADSVTRLIANKLADRWKQVVIVQNLPGAGGNIAARSTSITAPDGYTLLGTTTSLAINETLNKDKGFSVSSLTPIAIPVEAPELLASNPKSGIKTLADVMKVAAEGKLYMGSSGIGSGSHISAEYFFKVLAKTDVRHIPFSGGNPAKLALLTGDVNLMASTSSVMGSILNGELAGIAVGSAKRTNLLPQVPTYEEQGYGGFTPSSWTGVFAPTGTPTSVLEFINASVNQVLQDPEVDGQFTRMGLVTRSLSRAETVQFFSSEVEHWGKMVKAIGLQGAQ
jgi:tripartite-type tricarboxylate transporter receptor subunit TctC